jgi:hypothetical protein
MGIRLSSGSRCPQSPKGLPLPFHHKRPVSVITYFQTDVPDNVNPTWCRTEVFQSLKKTTKAASAPMLDYSSVIKFEVTSGPHVTVETMNFNRIGRRIELSPYSRIF